MSLTLNLETCIHEDLEKLETRNQKLETNLIPLSLYIHIPWCFKKCPYCDFNSHEKKDELPEDDYINALINDLEQALPIVWGRRIHTIFFGGGTPSLFSATGIEKILTAIRNVLTLNYDAEITLEANPGTFETEKFKAFADAGINRLSIGIQSFNPAHLPALGRVHDEKQAHQAIEIAQQHFANFNLDLMYALPQQTLAQAKNDIDVALQYSPPHLSAYHLTLEPNTLFYHQPPPLPDTELAADMQEIVESSLAQHGYQHYETSAFAKPGFKAKHNLNYWRFGDYLGIGAGAHSKITLPDRILRQVRHKHPKTYMQTVFTQTHIVENIIVTQNSLPAEFMMNALRLTQGFEDTLFTERTQLPIELIKESLALAQSRGLIEYNQGFIRPTLTGQRFLNDLLQLF